MPTGSAEIEIPAFIFFKCNPLKKIVIGNSPSPNNKLKNYDYAKGNWQQQFHLYKYGLTELESDLI